MRKITLPILLSTVLLVTVGCGNQNQSRQERTNISAEDVKQEAQETLETVSVYTQQQQQQYQEDVQAKLNVFDKRLDKLKTEAETAEEKATVKLNEQIEALEQKREAAAQRLEKLSSSQDEAWTEVKDGLDKAMSDLQQSYERALAEFE